MLHLLVVMTIGAVIIWLAVIALSAYAARSRPLGNGASGIRITNTDWQRLSFEVNPSADQVHRLTFKVGDNALLGPVRLHLDNSHQHTDVKGHSQGSQPWG